MVYKTQNYWVFGLLPDARPLTAQDNTNKRRQTSMPFVVFEPTIPVFEQGEDISCLRPRGHCDRSS
jgi:hypothetical protein